MVVVMVVSDTHGVNDCTDSSVDNNDGSDRNGNENMNIGEYSCDSDCYNGGNCGGP